MLELNSERALLIPIESSGKMLSKKNSSTLNLKLLDLALKSGKRMY
jgi:hypothetical protein